jgi:hypothetical protein
VNWSDNLLGRLCGVLAGLMIIVLVYKMVRRW